MSGQAATAPRKQVENQANTYGKQLQNSASCRRTPQAAERADKQPKNSLSCRKSRQAAWSKGNPETWVGREIQRTVRLAASK